MGSCKECYHYEVCRMHYQQKCELTYETEKEVRRAMLEAEKGNPICDHFKDRSRFVELPYYKYTAEERFWGAVQELIDIAKASETPSKILRATSESLAHFACELSKLEETKQTLKECKNNAN